MLDEVYTWIEEYAGTSYDFDEAIQEIDGNAAFLSPFEWRTAIDLILDQMDDALDIVDKYWRLLPDTLPNRTNLKRMITETTLRELVKNVDSVCKQLNINTPTMTTVDDLRDIVVALCELLDILIEHDTDDIIKNKLYEEHEENNEDSFAYKLDIQKEDMTQLSFNVSSIRQAYFEGLDEDEESY